MPARDKAYSLKEVLQSDRSTKEKFEYFFQYYRVHVLLTALVLAIVIASVISAGNSRDIYFQMAFTDGHVSERELEDYLTPLFLNEETINDYMVITRAFPVDQPEMVQALTVFIHVGDVDLLISSVENFQNFTYNEFLMPLSNLDFDFPEGVIKDEYGFWFSYLDLPYVFESEPLVASVPITAHRKEILTYFLQQQLQ